MLSSLHPISLFTRTDAELTTLYHSFYLIEYIRDQDDTRVVQRYPHDKPQIDTIESGLKIFILQRLSYCCADESTGKFVVTSSDSSRYFAFFRSYKDRVFVAVSSLPNMSLSRTIFDLLHREPAEYIPSVLLLLTEIPILPGVGLQYDVKLTSGIASLKFSLAEQVEDIDVDFIVLNMLTPIILVRAWESLILERKLLVVSSSDACVIACCEFLRRIVLPLSIVSTYVPLLPLQLIDTVDAPFPYLLGANSKMLKENIFDLQDTIVIDLDTRRLIPAASSTDTDPFASVQIIAKLIQEVHEIMIEPLGEWFDRSSDDMFGAASPYTADSYCLRSAKLLQIFKRTNLELMSARSCSVNAFWRRPMEPLVLQPGRNSSKTAFNVAPWRESIHGSPLMRRSNGLMMMGGFNYQDGICSGFMQLYKELQDENEQISNFLQCWVELDQYVLAVYQYADDLPILSVLVKDIQTASPVAVEPEGHVFELVIKDSMSYRFTVTDPESRQKWIATIDRRKDMDFSKTNDHDCYDVFAAATETEKSDSVRRKSSAVFESGVSPLANGSSLLGASVVPVTTTTPLKRLTSSDLSRGLCAVVEGSVKRTWTGYEMKLLAAEVNDASHNGGTTSNGTSNASSAPNNTDNPNASTSGNSVSLGYPQPCPEESGDILSAMAKEDSFFRFNFSRTQMMTSLHSQLECVEYNEIFKKLNIRMEKLLSEAFVLDDRLNIHYQAVADGRSGDSSRPQEALSQSSPRLLSRTLTAVGTDSGSAPLRTQNSQRSRLFNGFFNKKVDTEEELEKQQQLELKREQEAELRRRQVAEEERRADLRTKIYILTAAYRKTQPELIDLTVQNRQGALQGLVYDYIRSVYSPDDYCKGEQRPKHAVLTFCVADMLHQLKPLFEKTESPPVDPSFSICSEEASSKAYQWISHIWLGMTGKSWDQYCFEPPLSVQLQNYSEQDSNSSLVYDDEQVSTTSTTTSATISTRADQIQELIFLADQRNKQEELQKRQIRELLLAYLLSQHQEKLPDPEFKNYVVVTKSLLGLMYQTLGHSKEALECYADGALVDQRRVMTCLVLQFIAQAKVQEGLGEAADRSRANDFIEWGSRISALMGKYAYRLILELIYTNLLTALDQNNSSTDEISGMNAELELGSFRTFSGSHRSVGVANRKAARSKVQLSGTILNTDFVYVPNTDLKTEYLNSALICTSIKVERSAGDLSMLLLTELTEIMKTYCKSPAGIKNSARSTFGYSKLKINPGTMEALTSTSAFKAFEQHCCILQKLELIGMHIDERVQFFVNIYNTLTVHSLMLKGSPGTSMLERSSFMRNSKYNIGGNLFSLFEIEHGILRHSSTKAMIFGPLTISVNFGEKDPRRKLVLEQSRPNISFCLFTAMVSSPALVVLKDSSTVNEDMNHHARRFLLEYVKPDPVVRSICLPALLRIYWSDFGGSRYRVLKSIGAITGPEMANNLKPYMSPTEGLRAKVEFSKLDWTPIIAVCD